MRHAILLAALLPAVVSAQSNRGRGGPPTTLMSGGPPTEVVAPEVPLLEGMSHAVKIGFTVYVSGMVPLDSAGRIVGAGNLSEQTRQALFNLGAVMRAARGVPGDVVRATVYIKDLTPAKVALVRAEVLDALDRTAPPALTIVGVSSLADPMFEVTIEATGQLRSEFPDKARLGKP
jgi:2-iminobutanoate/2-iminopropanoate deaminase